MSRRHRRTAGTRSRTDGNRIPIGSGSAADELALALRHHRAGRPHDAERYYRRALEFDPTDPDALNHFGQFLMEMSNLEGALAVFTRALSIRETPQVKAMFVGCLQRVRHVPEVPALRRLVVRALSDPWARPADIAYAAISLIKNGIGINECIARAAAAWPRRLTASQLFGPPGLAAITGDELLRTTLESAPVCDADLERFLTMFRSATLEVASTDGGAAPINDAVLAVYCALARQCFINEYVFALADGESRAGPALARFRGTGLGVERSCSAVVRGCRRDVLSPAFACRGRDPTGSAMVRADAGPAHPTDP